MNYKETLNLPKTDFPMKASLPEREPDFLKVWDSKKIYESLLKKNKDKPHFVLHDGPPYANGNIHFGHILNKILKDIIVKYKNMAGYKSVYIPGWDCHGLPIELGAIQELSKKEESKNQLDNPLSRRKACREYAMRFVKEQTKEFKRLGNFGDWEKPYLTLAPKYEADIAREFVKLYTKGYVYQGKKPVYWCSSCQTALAEAEVEYEDLTSPSIYVKFKLVDSSPLNLGTDVGDKEVSMVIWTTTPWTLPANLALAIGAEFNYVALECENQIYIVAKELSESFIKAIQFKGKTQEVGLFDGETLGSMNLCCEHPFIDRQSRVVLSDHVSLESGTGIVHIAPGHGQEDYEVGKTNNLETLCPIDECGKIMEGALENARFKEIKDWEGLFIKKADPMIVDFLAREKILLNKVGETLSHSYPHCWRCKKPVIFRATKQWFCSMEHADLRKRALRKINGDVKWIPSWGRERIYGMIESRPDWCLSRQRIWGVPIIVHHCVKCQKPLLDVKVGDYICCLFETEGADVWWKDDKPLLPQGTKCECGGTQFTKEKSILDVWFDSGVSHAAVLDRIPELKSPADLYLEGSDQHRGWFHSSLLTSMATKDQAPYKAVLTHGFVVDGNGKKYSKSAKNYIPPDKIINEVGAEILRLWVAAEDYRTDIRVSQEIMKVLSEVYRKIRNTNRFLLGNLFDFNPNTDSIPYAERTELDRYALSVLAEVIEKVEKAFENYEFHIVHHTLNKFFTVDLSAFYLDILKDRLYCEKTNGNLRRSAQSTLYDILKTMIPLMSPILSFTAEEIWAHMPKEKEASESVFLADWPKIPQEWKNHDIKARWERLGVVRDEILKALEGARQRKEIGHPLDAKVILSAEGETLLFIRKYEKDWPQILIVSQVYLQEDVDTVSFESKIIPDLQVTVVQAEGKKCERCWNYSTTVGGSQEHPTICKRCVKTVS